MISCLNKHLYFSLVVVFFFIFNGCYSTGYVYDDAEVNVHVSVPAWAPPYDDVQHVRYYYMPDIEVYFDLSNQEFVYLQDGSWMFSSSFPQMYPGFDLNNSYVVMLDNQVYEPWMHHHYYISHYPRYYYHSVYNVTDTRDIRGFNENKGKEIRLRQDERIRTDAVSRDRTEPRQIAPAIQVQNAVPRIRTESEQITPAVQEQRKSVSTRAPQPVRYYGPDVGKPVKVEKQMTRPRENVQRKKEQVDAK